jgi:hypothetical protein
VTQISGINASAIYFPASARQAAQAAGDSAARQYTDRFSASSTASTKSFSLSPGLSLAPGDFAQVFSQISNKTGISLFQTASLAYGRAMLLGVSRLSFQV